MNGSGGPSTGLGKSPVNWGFGDDFMTTGAVVSHTCTWYGSFTVTVVAQNSVMTTYASTVVVIAPHRVYLPAIHKVVPYRPPGRSPKEEPGEDSPGSIDSIHPGLST